MRVLIIILLLTPTTALLGQSDSIRGHSMWFSTDNNVAKNIHFKLVKKNSSIETIYKYCLNSTYLFNNGDTIQKKTFSMIETFSFIKQDSTLKIKHPNSQRVDFIILPCSGLVKDSLVQTDLLQFNFNDSDYPDDQMFYLFHPDYGLVLKESKAWWWFSYYYLDNTRFVRKYNLGKKDPRVFNLQKHQLDSIRRAKYEIRTQQDTINGFYIPHNLEDCFLTLNNVLSFEDIQKIKTLEDANETIKYHHGLGTWIRNNWGLWGGSRLSIYFTSRMDYYEPDRCSGMILENYWYWLNNDDSWKKWELEHPIKRE